MGGFEKKEANVPSTDDLMNSVTPMSGGKDKVKVRSEQTIETVKLANPGHDKINAKNYPHIIKIMRDGIKQKNKDASERGNAERKRDGKPPLKGGPSPVGPGDGASYVHKEYNSKTKLIDETPFGYGVGRNGEHILVAAPKKSRQPNKQEQANLDDQVADEKEEIDKELAEHIAKVLKENFKGKPTLMGADAKMAKFTIKRNKRSLKNAGDYAMLTKGGNKWLAIHMGGNKINVYEGRSA